MNKRSAKKRIIPSKVKKVALPSTAVLEVAVPKGHVPIVAADPRAGVVKIIPVPVAKIKDETWWQRWFG